MKYFTLIFALILTNQAVAHTDHALGEGTLHLVYHLAFWGIFAAVVVKGFHYFKNKKSQKVEK
ncbi:hypothetical protein [Psychromonas sp.]|uniref:hypothetical protein n=1 Tax=Psychromonas sp. TaxID=1884585 RepID=UPI003565C399